MSDPIGQVDRETRFNNLHFWISSVNHLVGQGNWYIAGGFAAHMRIEAASKDADYYATVSESIFPSDIEIGVLKDGAALLEQRYHEMLVVVGGRAIKVDLQAQELGTLATHIERSSMLSEVFVYTPSNLIKAYQSASDPAKAAKRKTRVAMLQLIQAGKTIDKAGVDGGDAALTADTLRLGLDNLAAFKLRPTKPREKATDKVIRDMLAEEKGEKKEKQ